MEKNKLIFAFYKLFNINMIKQFNERVTNNLGSLLKIGVVAIMLLCNAGLTSCKDVPTPAPPIEIPASLVGTMWQLTDFVDTENNISRPLSYDYYGEPSIVFPEEDRHRACLLYFFNDTFACYSSFYNGSTFKYSINGNKLSLNQINIPYFIGEPVDGTLSTNC